MNNVNIYFLVYAFSGKIPELVLSKDSKVRWSRERMSRSCCYGSLISRPERKLSRHLVWSKTPLFYYGKNIVNFSYCCVGKIFHLKELKILKLKVSRFYTVSSEIPTNYFQGFWAELFAAVRGLSGSFLHCLGI